MSVKGSYINGVPQRWKDFDKIYMDGTDAIYGTSSLSAAAKAAKYGFTIEKTGTHISNEEPNNSPNPGNPFIEQMMKNVDPHRYATDAKYKQGVDQMLRAAVRMGYEETPQPEYLRPDFRK